MKCKEAKGNWFKLEFWGKGNEMKKKLGYRRFSVRIVSSLYTIISIYWLVTPMTAGFWDLRPYLKFSNEVETKGNTSGTVALRNHTAVTCPCLHWPQTTIQFAQHCPRRRPFRDFLAANSLQLVATYLLVEMTVLAAQRPGPLPSRVALASPLFRCLPDVWSCSCLWALHFWGCHAPCLRARPAEQLLLSVSDCFRH